MIALANGCFGQWSNVIPKVARAAIGGAETGGGIVIPEDPLPQEQRPSPPVGERDRWAKDDFRNEDASFVEAFRTEIEGALGMVLEQVTVNIKLRLLTYSLGGEVYPGGGRCTRGGRCILGGEMYPGCTLEGA